MDAARIKVLVTAFAPVPGSSPHAAALLAMVAALRAEIDLVTVKTDLLAHLERYGEARMFRVPVTGSAAEQRASFARAIKRQLEGQAYDVVHVRGPFEGVVAAERHRDLGFRFVYEVATYPDESESGDESLWASAHARCLDAADLVLVPTESAARSLGDRGYGEKVAVVPPGVDVDAFDWSPIGQPDEARLLYLGTFAADRDPGTLLGAIRVLARERPIQALIAGEPDRGRRERVKRIVEAFGLKDLVQIRAEPRSIALPSLISAAHVCLVPASATPRFQELGDLPQPLLEYMACRRPVVAAGVPGVAEVVRDEKEGLLYAPGDETMLAEGILTMLDKTTLRRRLVEAAYDRVRWHFSGGARRRRITEVYEMLVPGSQRYDAWSEAFSEDASGQLGVPSTIFDLGSAGTGSGSSAHTQVTGFSIPDIASFESESTGVVTAATPDTGDEVLPEVARTPAYPGRAGEDTSPGLPTPDDDDEVSELPLAPTKVHTRIDSLPPAPPEPEADAARETPPPPPESAEADPEPTGEISAVGPAPEE